MFFNKLPWYLLLGKTHDFAFSKKHHFDYFRFKKYDLEYLGRPVDEKSCDLKIYQDLLVLAFLRENIPKGSKLLDIGGGNSRVLRFVAKDYECWNIDKMEGLGEGPTANELAPYRLVLDYMGNFNKELPDSYFDFVFSVSALEHVGEDAAWHAKICDDIDRVLKPSGFSLHCLDSLVNRKDHQGVLYNWTCGILQQMIGKYLEDKKYMAPKDFILGKDLYCMPEKVYEKWVQPNTKVSYQDFGQPFSYNILWQKTKNRTKTIAY